ncbi:hypothetical protein SAY87_026426 [Trapa incisa]|uniref:Uncharacterized protein n=1 Tax=Trapa incisa TaxID=236973 RepID=A0AAN7H3V8_9MYRT|nr:hypothetical protein SAY87_026426 [Trapa incisa]
MEHTSTRSHTMKRKISEDQAPTPEEEDEKIETFFALIRTMREARDRLSIIGNPVTAVGGSFTEKRSKAEESREPIFGWRPAFKLEDFMQEQHTRTGDSSTQKKATASEMDRQETKVSLDLKLSL